MTSDNADDFLTRLLATRSDYRAHASRLIGHFRQVLEGRGLPAEVAGQMSAKLLEDHARQYMVDALLDALNWSIGFTSLTPNTLPEVPILSQERSRTRYLDYLGFDRIHLKPSLVVETKRPDLALPSKRFDDPQAQQSPGALISAGLSGVDVGSEWNEWLATVRDYVRSVKAASGSCPQRALVTNGEWLVVFADPEDAFSSPNAANIDRIHVFRTLDEVAARYSDVYALLEYRCVTGEIGGVAPGAISALVDRERISGILHGALLNYNEVGMGHGRTPAIYITPALFLRLDGGKYLRVESQRSFPVPHEYAGIGAHLSEVSAAAAKLKADVELHVGRALEVIPATSHDGAALDASLPFVSVLDQRNPGMTLMQIVTGDRHHYFSAEPTVNNCAHHTWQNSHAAGCGEPIVLVRAVSPKSFFTNDEVHHCCHRDVRALKAAHNNAHAANAPVSPDNRAFCKIWRFEQRLCCRTCSFELVCGAVETFTLPCSTAATS